MPLARITVAAIAAMATVISTAIRSIGAEVVEAVALLAARVIRIRVLILDGG